MTLAPLRVESEVSVTRAALHARIKMMGLTQAHAAESAGMTLARLRRILGTRGDFGTVMRAEEWAALKRVLDITPATLHEMREGSST